MGYENLATKSKEQLAQHIRALASDPAKVLLTRHVRMRMLERCVTRADIDECLRLGSMRRSPECNESMKSLECRMERLVDGRELATVVALCDENPAVVVVTVFETNR